MSGRERRASAVRQILHDVLKRIDPQDQMKVYDVWRFWADEVGTTLADRSRPSAFRNGVLIVTVGQHAWLQELQFVKDVLRERLNARLGREMIRDIYFVSGSVENNAPLSNDDRETKTPSTSPRTLVLPAIANPDLAASFERVVRAHTRRTAQPARVRSRRKRRT